MGDVWERVARRCAWQNVNNYKLKWVMNEWVRAKDGLCANFFSKNNLCKRVRERERVDEICVNENKCLYKCFQVVVHGYKQQNVHICRRSSHRCSSIAVYTWSECFCLIARGQVDDHKWFWNVFFFAAWTIIARSMDYKSITWYDHRPPSN